LAFLLLPTSSNLRPLTIYREQAQDSRAMFALSFLHKLIVGLASACLVLLLVAGLTYAILARSSADQQWVAHTFLVLEILSDLQTQVADAETGQRGFLLTGDAAYLDAYQTSLTQIPATLLALRQLTADNPAQQRSIDLLDFHISTRLAVLHDVIEIRQHDGLAAVQSAVFDEPGRRRMEAIRVDAANIKAEESRLLLIRKAALDFSTRRGILWIILGEALGFSLLLMAGTIVHQEMSERRRGQAEIRRLNADLELRVTELATRSKDLERSNVELQQFAYVASHDLQEPLRTISSFTQLLAKRYREQLDDKAREFIDFTVDGCQRMQTLINDLLSLSRVGIDSKPLLPVLCDAVLDRVLRILRVAILEGGAEIHRAPLPVVMAEEVQLAQLFQNLIVNAIKFRGPLPPRIEIFAHRQGTSWTISVRDNGIGIAPEHSSRIFVIFQRLHTRAQYSGTGIGLAVCKKIAELHGGSIAVRPAPEGGSIFSFTMTPGEIDHPSGQEDAQSELRSNAAAH
jgi:signal transduction histidine kinase